MTDDAKAIVLLCGHLGSRVDPGDAAPLSPSEYADLVRWLLAHDLRPADLLDASDGGAHVAAAAAGSDLPEPRLSALLERGVQLGFTVERWTQSGLWVLSRSDPDYPARVKSHLRKQAPPVLYGAGDRALLADGEPGGGGPVGGGLAILGSRNTDEAGQELARDVAAWCARHGTPVVTAGPRGKATSVAQAAMTAALEFSAPVTTVLADNLLKASVARDARRGLAAGSLLLLSPYHPEARHTAAAAAAATATTCSALIFALSDYALIVSTNHGKGATWQAATAELKRTPARPVFVRTTGSPPRGNTKLLDLGALPFPDIDEDADPHTLLRNQATDVAQAPTPVQGSFDFAEHEPTPSGTADETSPTDD